MVVAAVVFVGAVIYMIVNRGRPREVFGRFATGSGDGDPGTPGSVASTNSTGDPDEDQRAQNEVEARSKEKSSAAEPGGKGGASERQQRRRGARRPAAGARAGRAGGAPVARHELTQTSPPGLPRVR